MKKLDRDLRLGRIAAYAVLCLNVAMAVMYAYQRHWGFAVSHLIWMACCLIWAWQVVPMNEKSRRMSRENAENIAELAAQIRQHTSARNN